MSLRQRQNTTAILKKIYENALKTIKQSGRNKIFTVLYKMGNAKLDSIGAEIVRHEA